VHQALYRWDVWAAACLIGGGCSDDSFIDFRAGLIAQGRVWYQKAADSPDSLADHPAVATAAHRPWDNPQFYEQVNYAASYAFERVSGDGHAFWDALDSREKRDPADMGEHFDFDDEKEMHRRQPLLSALCLAATPPKAEPGVCGGLCERAVGGMSALWLHQVGVNAHAVRCSVTGQTEV
jgi:hypothetical protein